MSKRYIKFSKKSIYLPLLGGGGSFSFYLQTIMCRIILGGMSLLHIEPNDIMLHSLWLSERKLQKTPQMASFNVHMHETCVPIWPRH